MALSPEDKRTRHRQRYAEKYHVNQKAAQRVKVADIRSVIHAAKDVPCADCGQRHPHYVMDFDHVRGDKIKPVSHMLSWSLIRVLEEIAKCEVVCANCHRERTHQLRQYCGPAWVPYQNR